MRKNPAASHTAAAQISPRPAPIANRMLLIHRTPASVTTRTLDCNENARGWPTDALRSAKRVSVLRLSRRQRNPGTGEAPAKAGTGRTHVSTQPANSTGRTCDCHRRARGVDRAGEPAGPGDGARLRHAHDLPDLARDRRRGAERSIDPSGPLERQALRSRDRLPVGGV